MAGFMSGGLGFSSTVGSLVAGAARQANEVFSEQRQQQRQDDIMQNEVWQNKTDNNIKQYNTNKADFSYRERFYNSIKTISGGDPKVADYITALVEKHPKLLEDTANLTNYAKSFAAANVKAEPDYQSQYLGSLQNEAANSFGYTKNSVDRMPEKYRNRAGEISPWQVGQQTATSSLPAGPVTGSGVTSPSVPSVASAPGTSPIVEMSSNKPKTLLTANDAKDYENEDAFSAALRDRGQSPNIAKGAMTADKLHTQKLDQAAAGKALIPPPGSSAYEAELGKQYGKTDTTDYTKLSQDVNTFISLAENGQLKTGGIQPMLDAINSVSTPLGIDFSKYLAISGLTPNSPMNSDVAKKTITMLQADVVAAQHFARVTNFEYGTLGNAVIQMGTNMKANIFVGVMLKGMAERAMQASREASEKAMEIDPRTGDLRLNVYKKNQAAQQWLTEHANIPVVPQIDTKTMNQDQIHSTLRALGPNKYYIDISKGLEGLNKTPDIDTFNRAFR